MTNVSGTGVEGRQTLSATEAAHEAPQVIPRKSLSDGPVLTQTGHSAELTNGALLISDSHGNKIKMTDLDIVGSPNVMGPIKLRDGSQYAKFPDGTAVLRDNNGNVNIMAPNGSRTEIANAFGKVKQAQPPESEAKEGAGKMGDAHSPAEAVKPERFDLETGHRVSRTPETVRIEDQSGSVVKIHNGLLSASGENLIASENHIRGGGLAIFRDGSRVSYDPVGLITVTGENGQSAVVKIPSRS